MRKSVEQLLFEAFTKGTGVRLSAEQVTSLVADDAVAYGEWCKSGGQWP